MPRLPVIIIALFFLLGGIAHFAYMDAFVAAMPAYLGFHEELVIVSGVFEIAGAVGILIPRTRRVAGYGLIALAFAVFPANINMALHPEKFPALSQTALYLRLPLQFVLVWFIWWATTPKKQEHATTDSGDV